MDSEKSGTGEFDATFDHVDLSGSALEARTRKVRGQFWDKFRRVAASIPFADELVAAYYCAMDPDTPTKVRGMLLGALAYFILPVDAVPDIIAGIGYTDDAAVLAAVVSLVARHIGPGHREAAARALGKSPPEEGDSTTV